MRQNPTEKPDDLRARLRSEGYDGVYPWSDPPGAVYALHRHETDQTHWIVSGELEITLETGESYLLKSGDRDFLPAQTGHRARVIGEGAVSYLIGEKL